MPFKDFKQKLQDGGSCEKLSMALEKVEAARKAITGEQCCINGDYSPGWGAPVLGLGVRCSKRWLAVFLEAGGTEGGLSLTVAGRELGLLTEEAKK